MKIFKYVLKYGTQKIEVPSDFTILSCGIQNDVPVIWGECSPDAPRIRRVFKVIFTGETLDRALETYRHFIGTVQNSQEIVYHIYQV